MWVSQQMRETHQSRLISSAVAGHLAAAQTRQLRIAHAGVLQAQDSPLWLTREGDPDDHVLDPGECLHLRAGDRVIVGAWRHHEASAWQWRPERVASVNQRLGRALIFLLAGGLDRLARGLEAWAALARRTAAGASRSST